jgi:hypothetical protein
MNSREIIVYQQRILSIIERVSTKLSRKILDDRALDIVFGTGSNLELSLQGVSHHFCNAAEVNLAAAHFR